MCNNRFAIDLGYHRINRFAIEGNLDAIEVHTVAFCIGQSDIKTARVTAESCDFGMGYVRRTCIKFPQKFHLGNLHTTTARSLRIENSPSIMQITFLVFEGKSLG